MEKELLKEVEEQIKISEDKEMLGSWDESQYQKGRQSAFEWLKNFIGGRRMILVGQEGKGESKSVDLTNATVVDNYFDQASPEFNPYPMTREQIIDVKENGSRYNYDRENKIWIKCHE